MTKVGLAFLCAFALGLAASVRIPLPFTPVPMTGQTFVLFLSAALLGRHYASQMVAWYLVLGASGLPFFAGGAAGLAVLSGPTAGYLIGFFVSATFIGYGQKHVCGLWSQALLFLTASLLLFACGVGWLALAMKLTLTKALIAGFLPFIVGDLIKIALAAGLIHGVKKSS